MRRGGLLVLLALAACDCGGTGVAGARLTATPGLVELDKVVVGLAARVEVVLENRGGETFWIDRAEPLGELASVLRLEGVPAGVAPQSSTPVQFVFEPRMRGEYAGEVVIVGAEQTLSIPVTGLGVDGRLVVFPEVVDFGEVLVGLVATATASITNLGDGPVDLLALGGDAFTSTEFTATLPGIQMLGPGDVFEFAIRFEPLFGGQRTGRIVATTDDASMPVPPSVRVLGDALAAELEVEPNQIDFVGVLVGESRVRMLEIRNVGSSTESVSGMSLSARGPFRLDPMPTLPIEIPKGGAVRLGVRFQPVDLEPASTTLVIESVENGLTLMVRLAGQAESAPRPLVELSVPGQDTVEIGQSVARPIRVRNHSIGGAGLTVTIDPPTAPFSFLAPPPTTIGGGDVQIYALEIAPVLDGLAEAELVLSIPSAEVPEVRARLSVVGVRANVPDLVAPDRVDIGRIARGETVRRHVRLKNAGRSILTFGDVTVDDPRITLDTAFLTALSPGEESAIGVTFSDPLGLAQSGQAQLFIASNDPDNSGVEVVRLPFQTMAPSPNPPMVRVELESLDPASDFDLHALGDDAALFDAPGDACACNPRPDWGRIGEIYDDPRFLDDAPGPGLEALVLEASLDQQITVVAVHSRGLGPAEVRVTAAMFGRSETVSRIVPPGQAFLAFDLFSQNGAWAITPLGEPLLSPSSDSCY